MDMFYILLPFDDLNMNFLDMVNILFQFLENITNITLGNNFLGLGLVVPEICTRLLFLKLRQLLATLFDSDIFGHLGNGLLKRLNARPYLLGLEEFLFCRFCHDNYSK